jgi:tetratricopeptide (TPR) repeat protein
MEVLGDSAAARIAFEAALQVLDSALAELPDDWRVHAAIGYSEAGLGRREAARRQCAWLRGSEVYLTDALYRPYLAEACAKILARVGYVDKALDEVEQLLAGPSWLSAHTLRMDPRWDPIREHPRFQSLLVRYANPEPVL